MDKDVKKTKSLTPQTPSPWMLGFTTTMLVLGATMGLTAWLAKLGINTPLLPSINQWLNQEIDSSSRLLFSHFLTATGLLGTGVEITKPSAIKGFLQSWSSALINLLSFGLLQKTWQQQTTNDKGLQHNTFANTNTPPINDGVQSTASDSTKESWTEQKSSPAIMPGVRGYNTSAEKSNDITEIHTTSAGCQA